MMTSIANYPTQHESWLTLKNGKTVFLRPIMPTDEHLVVGLFQKLSPESLYFRFLMRLDALPKDILYRFTHVNYNTEFALVAIIEEDGKDAIIAIARYGHTPHEILPDIAIAVRDDWHHFGLGKALFKKLVEIGKEHGIYRFGGMIDPQNKIILQTLSELGYTVKYALKSGIFQVEITV